MIAWASGRDDELEFWEDYLKTRGGEWPEDFVDRMDPELPLQQQLTRHLSHVQEQDVLILDCGAGPLTVVGKRWGNHRVSVTAVDALADDYDRLLAKHSITPPVRTRRCEVEHLDELFPEDHFDLVHMRNALDHCYDPLAGLRQMIRVVKPNCAVFLDHEIDVGAGAEYAGLHQWNFCSEDGRFVMWNPRRRVVVEDELPNTEVSISYHDEEWITVVMYKRKRTSSTLKP
jgi:SAM-dependent methyltransferase